MVKSTKMLMIQRNIFPSIALVKIFINVDSLTEQ